MHNLIIHPSHSKDRYYYCAQTFYYTEATVIANDKNEEIEV
jgi:hypothetical protein